MKMKKNIYTKYLKFRFISKILIAILLFPFIYNYIPMKSGDKTFYLPSSHIDDVINTLQEHGYGVSFIDKLMLRYLKAPSKGWYTLEDTSYGRFNFFALLDTQHAKTLTVKLYAGENSIELTKRLANDLKLNPDRLLQAYQKRSIFTEADLFSGRYEIAHKAKEDAVMDALFYFSKEKLAQFEHAYENITNNRLEHKILLTIASIIQKESNHAEEMPLISSVIYNRLEKNMKLQMDGTLNYGKYSHHIINSNRIKTDISDYNTYKNKGLPPTPLCTISMEALEAAYLPETTNYLFFMLNKKGKHTFATTYKEHLKNIRAFKGKPKKKKKKKKIIKDSNLSEAIASVK